MVSTGDPHLRGTHDQWLVKGLNPVPVGCCDCRLVILIWSLLWLGTPWFEVPPTPAFLGVGWIGFWLPLALFQVPGFFVAGLCSSSCLSSVFSPLRWFLPPFLIIPG